MNPGRPRLAAGLLALLAVTACNGNDDDEAQLELAVGAGEVRVLGDYENDLPLLIHDVSVGGDGLVYVQVRGGHVWRAGADDDLSPCCGASGIGDGGIAVAGDTVYIVHGDAADPPQR
ncbi:MAG: hypothetical protein ACRD0U_03975, partial [Acidimicrobiales bacterium]